MDRGRDNKKTKSQDQDALSRCRMWKLVCVWTRQTRDKVRRSKMQEKQGIRSVVWASAERIR